MISSKRLNENPSTRIFGLDVFRALAVIFVVMGHGRFLVEGTFLEKLPFFRMIEGVDLFFVLSGFLIGNILLKEINSKEEFGFGELGRFWKRRWMRTLPNYYLVLTLNYLIVYFGIIHEDIHQFSWKFIFFLQNFSSSFHGFFWESWSLTIEEWFYISAPLLLIIFLRFFSPKISFLFVTLLLIVFPFIYRIGIMDISIVGFWYDISFRKVVLTRLDSIAFGLLAAWTYFYFNVFWVKTKYYALFAGILFVVIVLNVTRWEGIWYDQVIFFTLSPAAAILFLPFAQGISTGKGILARVITHISKISYSMYLINLALVSEVIRDNFSPTGRTDGLIKYIIYWFVIIAASSIIYKYFEKPIMNLRNRK